VELRIYDGPANAEGETDVEPIGAACATVIDPVESHMGI